MASGDAVNQIKERLSIIDVVAPYVELKPAGKNMKGKSPFTEEKTPSFFVSPDRGMYYCFSTSKGGDIFTFTQEMEGVDFKGALKILAEKAGVELVAEDPQKRTEREEQYAILEAATLFYQSKLKGTAAAEEYLQKRGVKDETISAWRLGYAPGPPDAGWREVGTELKGKNYTDSALIKAGILKQSEQGKEPYDVFRDRIMFPLFDPSGRVIAFSGRILSKDSEAPKYVNSPETELFNKSEALYGYDRAKQGIRKFDFSLIVEGQFDVVLAHQAGYTNTVAVSGTALTPHHVALLQRMSNRVVLALDADRAGIAAVKRSADVMLVRGMDVKVAIMPDGEDPADIIQSDPAKFKQIIGHSVHVIEFLLQVLKTHAKDDRSYKLQARDEVVPYVLKLQSHIDRDHFESVIASALGTTKDAVHLEVERLAESVHVPKQPSTTAVKQVLERKDVLPNQARQSALRAYVAIGHELALPHLQDKLKLAVEDLLSTSLETILKEVPAQQHSEYSFTIENLFADLSEREQRVFWNDKYRELALLYVRDELGKAKEAFYAAEQAGTDTETLLQEVNNWQKRLTEASTERDIFAETNQSEAT